MIAWIVALWLALSIPVSLFIGAFINEGQREWVK